jgi:hypothetical protein
MADEVGVDSATCVFVGVLTGVAVGAARFVAVGEGRGVSVGASGIVAVGEGREVGVGAPMLVALGEGAKSVDVSWVVPVGAEVDSSVRFTIVVAVPPASLVAVKSSIDPTVGVGDNDMDVARISLGFARAVAEELVEANSVGEGNVDVGTKA